MKQVLFSFETKFKLDFQQKINELNCKSAGIKREAKNVKCKK